MGILSVMELMTLSSTQSAIPVLTYPGDTELTRANPSHSNERDLPVHEQSINKSVIETHAVTRIIMYVQRWIMAALEVL